MYFSAIILTMEMNRQFINWLRVSSPQCAAQYLQIYLAVLEYRFNTCKAVKSGLRRVSEKNKEHIFQSWSLGKTRDLVIINPIILE